jgi:hypothetical protein
MGIPGFRIARYIAMDFRLRQIPGRDAKTQQAKRFIISEHLPMRAGG